MIKQDKLHKDDDPEDENIGSGIASPEISTEVSQTGNGPPAIPLDKETETPKPEASEDNTIYITFYKTSKEAGWSLFPKISSGAEQATNRVKSHVSTVDIQVVPVDLP